MANVKITELSELFANVLAVEDVLPIVDLSANETKKVSVSSILTLAYANDFATYSELPNNISSVEVRRDANTFYSYDGSTANVSANLIPSTSYDIGSTQDPWNNIYVANINLGSISIQQQDNALLITDAYNASVIIDTSINNISFSINQVSSNVDSLSAEVDALQSNIFYQSNSHSVIIEANLVSNAQSSLGSESERWSNTYTDTINLGSFEIQQTQTSNVNVTGAVIYSRDKNTFNSVKLLVNVEDLTYNQYQSSEILLVHDKNIVRLTEYAIVHTSTNPIATFDAAFSGNLVQLSVSAQSSDNIITVLQFTN